MTNISDLLTKQLKEKNLSPADFARMTQKDQGVISRILSGERNPSMETLVIFSRALKVPLEIFLRAAKYLPQTNKDPWIEEMQYKVGNIKDEKRPMAKKLIQALLDEDGQ